MKKIYIGSMTIVIISITGLNSSFATDMNYSPRYLPASGLNSAENKKEQNNITDTTNREKRVLRQQERMLKEKIIKIHKKIAAHESLNRLEKKFADTNGIDYHN